MSLQQEILDNLGFEALTPMQTEMSERASQTSGLILLSPTGSGKTLAFLLPLLENVQASVNAVQAVIVVPVRELAQQIENVLRSTKTPLRFVTLYGGRPAMQEHRIIKEVNPQIVIATPGRLLDHIDKENLNVRGSRVLVIDEFDKCLELGFQKEMNSILQHLRHVRKCWLTSATESPEILDFMNQISHSFEKLDYRMPEETLQERFVLRHVISPKKDKLETLAGLLNDLEGQPSIVFVSHRESVERVGAYLSSQGFFVSMYHGGMEQEIRERALYRFRNGSANVLVSTDLAARGLDIPEVRAVIHYHLPLKEEDFIHRSGRTARWDMDGAVYLILSESETLPEYASVSELFELSGRPLQIVPPRFVTIYIGRGKKDHLSKGDILGFLCKKGGLKSAEIGRIDVGSHFSYAAVLRSRLKAVLKQIAGEKIKGMKTIFEETRNYNTHYDSKSKR